MPRSKSGIKRPAVNTENLVCASNKCLSANNNTKQVFNDDEEVSLKTYLLTTARHHYGLTKKEVRNLAYQFAVANGKTYPYSWNEEKTGGKEWLRQFLKRHQDLSLRKLKATSLARSTRSIKQTEWIVMNPAKPITIYEIAKFVERAFPKAFSTFNIQKGFEVTEFYPLNENAFEEHF
ncbi:hypothetical protein ILUMI_09276 [Ignelater luminosus]|uniref:HTH CENPB-type domain-containing protein n=1 Tax=Ignelater luminosus TaxID=2038154 RepID=A0A8K0D099_IGNLU|nr:hypothetical protein ILUMI_09276 [Ignelater luminosus]